MARGRPNFDKAVRALIRDISTRLAEFSHIRANRVLVVAGEARRGSRGAVKPLTFAGTKSRAPDGRRKPVVRVNGKRMLYCITLRPLFFRSGTPEERIATVIHELFHISQRFDGTLSDDRRHERLGKAFSKRLRPLVKRYLRLCPPELWAPFAYDGEVRVQQWLERPAALYVPGLRAQRRLYTEEQLFTAVVRMMSKKKAARVAAESKRRMRLH